MQPNSEQIQHFLVKQQRKLKRAERAIARNLEKCSRWLEIEHEADLIKSNFVSIEKNSSALSVYDWKTECLRNLTLDPLKTPKEQMAFRYKQAKKFKRGNASLKELLEKTRKEIALIEEMLKTHSPEDFSLLQNSLPDSLSDSLLDSLSPPAATASRSLCYREYQSIEGLKIWVGKNAKGNDQLTFQLANGRDWWLHASGCPGSHVIIRLVKEQEPGPETVKDAMQLALYYSKARSRGESEICFTQRKYVSRMGKNKAGLVQISKHQTAWIRFDPIRFAHLKECN